MAARLGRACRLAREGADLHALDVAQTARVSESTISRFEAGRAWARRTDEIVEAYEHELGLPADELWWRALQRPH